MENDLKNPNSNVNEEFAKSDSFEADFRHSEVRDM